MHSTRIAVALCLCATTLLAGAPVRGAEGGVQPLQINKPLLAAWSFDEQTGTACLDSSGNGCDAAPARKPGFERVPGVFGGAIGLADRHMIRVSDKFKLGNPARISFSAWVLPTGMERYTEIFRKEDGGNRVLFSFQENGNILSLGLNVGGYVECDAKIRPEQVLDGRWHHCAAVFDGKAMRVYLDGKQIGSLERPGTIVAGGPAQACIGSSNGGECFQGSMDELRIYADALTDDEVAQLHRNGLDAIAKLSERVEAAEPKVDKPLLAHWNFNERGATNVINDSSGRPDVTAAAGGPLPKTRGVFGNALNLRGKHALRAAGFLPGNELAGLSFSAWVKPTDLRGNREIFRQECGQRLLFSFQDNGTVLSLGLNVGGYQECDAPIVAAQVADGRWRHCAATFDGKFMRVYLDGKEIGSLERTGPLSLQPGAPGFIGSCGGESEHFQGALDDLRIYAAALTPEDVAFLHESGQESLNRRLQEIRKRLEALYAPEKNFAETLASCRRRILDQAAPLDAESTEALAATFKSAFPDECARLMEFTGSDLAAFLTSGDRDQFPRETERLMDLLLEYKPITEQQWKKQTPADLRRWQEADAIYAKYAALKAQDASRLAPDWVDLMMEAGKRIQFRPYVNEAVAPYVRPETPETRTLTAAEARAALERDWLHQAGQTPSPNRIRDEIQRARRLAARITARFPSETDFAKENDLLDDLDRKAADLKTPDPALYFKVREVKRSIMFRNPVVDFNKVLFVDMPYPQGSEWNHETRHRLGYMAVPGGRLLVLEGLAPDGKLAQLMPQPPLHGSFWRPDLSWDAKKVLFCFKPHNEKSFHLYEIGVDGAGLTQLTDGPYDDLDPIYLPDEHILFSTTRGHTYVRCMPPTNAYVLARCDRDGRNIYLVSMNNEPDYVPSVMHDGRVIYTRWEYTDKPLWRAQALWTVNPDGTQVYAFWGNQSVWPDLLKDARSIPGSRRIMFTGSAHHGWFTGCVGIIDPDKGYNFPDGLAKVTADLAWPESGNGPVDPVESPHYHKSGDYAAYYSPYPLSEQDFIVSANRGGKFILYLMDVEGNRELIYEGVHNIFHAMPLKPRPRPPVIPDQVEWPRRGEPKDGVIFSANVHQSVPPELRGKAKYLRVLTIEHKTYTYWHKRPYISTGPVVSAVQSEGVKRILGTAPIEADGSLAFYAPAGKPLHFQLLDENQRALQTMRSFTGVMPGERRGCLGCHESHSRAPTNNGDFIALRNKPRTITPPPWSDTTVSFARYVQPVLDKYCGKCHQGEGKARKALDFTDRPASNLFSEPYLLLIGRPSWGKPYVKPDNPAPGFGIAGMLMVEAYSTTDPQAYKTPPPMTSLSYRSRLIEIASSGKHHDVKVDDVSLLRLITWVDAMCPYLGDDEIRQIPDPEFQGVDWLAVRPKIQNAPRITRPGPVD